jgi:hypothetical protein
VSSCVSRRISKTSTSCPTCNVGWIELSTLVPLTVSCRNSSLRRDSWLRSRLWSLERETSLGRVVNVCDKIFKNLKRNPFNKYKLKSVGSNDFPTVVSLSPYFWTHCKHVFMVSSGCWRSSNKVEWRAIICVFDGDANAAARARTICPERFCNQTPKTAHLSIRTWSMCSK